MRYVWSALQLPWFIAAALTMVGQWNGLAMTHALCSLILVIAWSDLNFYIDVDRSIWTTASVSYSGWWNQWIYAMSAIVSIHIVSMISHRSCWLMSWLGGSEHMRTMGICWLRSSLGTYPNRRVSSVDTHYPCLEQLAATFFPVDIVVT